MSLEPSPNDHRRGRVQRVHVGHDQQLLQRHFVAAVYAPHSSTSFLLTAGEPEYLTCGCGRPGLSASYPGERRRLSVLPSPSLTPAGPAEHALAPSPQACSDSCPSLIPSLASALRWEPADFRKGRGSQPVQ